MLDFCPRPALPCDIQETKPPIWVVGGGVFTRVIESSALVCFHQFLDY